jgi:hypothetical protein
MSCAAILLFGIQAATILHTRRLILHRLSTVAVTLRPVSWQVSTANDANLQGFSALNLLQSLQTFTALNAFRGAQNPPPWATTCGFKSGPGHQQIERGQLRLSVAAIPITI